VFESLFTSEGLQSWTVEGSLSPQTTSSSRSWANTTLSVLRTSFTKSWLSDPTSSLHPTSSGPSSWTPPLVAGARRPTTLSRVVTSATGKIRLTTYSVTWSKPSLQAKQTFYIVLPCFLFHYMTDWLLNKVPPKQPSKTHLMLCWSLLWRDFCFTWPKTGMSLSTNNLLL